VGYSFCGGHCLVTLVGASRAIAPRTICTLVGHGASRVVGHRSWAPTTCGGGRGGSSRGSRRFVSRAHSAERLFSELFAVVRRQLCAACFVFACAVAGIGI